MGLKRRARIRSKLTEIFSYFRSNGSHQPKSEEVRAWAENLDRLLESRCEYGSGTVIDRDFTDFFIFSRFHEFFPSIFLRWHRIIPGISATGARRGKPRLHPEGGQVQEHGQHGAQAEDGLGHLSGLHRRRRQERAQPGLDVEEGHHARHDHPPPHHLRHRPRPSSQPALQRRLHEVPAVEHLPRPRQQHDRHLRPRGREQQLGGGDSPDPGPRRGQGDGRPDQAQSDLHDLDRVDGEHDEAGAPVERVVVSCSLCFRFRQSEDVGGGYEAATKPELESPGRRK